MRRLPTAHRSRFRLVDYEALYRRSPDPWGSGAPGSGRRRFEQAAALLAALRFEDALEIGCAGGFFLPRLARLSGRVLGVDLSERAVAAARRRVRGLPGVRVEAGNFMAMGLEARFDLVCCLHVLTGYEPPVQRRMLEKIRAALKPGGLGLFMVTARPHGLFDPAAFRGWLRGGFEVLREREFRTAGRSSTYGHLAVLAARR